ncbi:MAG: cob(I)yrinic acid a,c-diamide adenosyltransferase [Spirochaetales bacterium]|nr:cob(I)yrinic acid a,c-diamide adenosyltransferase [Leptospiraceae bacterium]MCP5482899.1 cob(I)yrinic acid a,c-diamide adenosyltransferase [Spirochaetales bacterium]
MQVYTRTGDDGNTHLASGKRVPKHALRVEIYGECDELNSVLGLAISLCEGPLEGLGADLTNEQHLLFELGSELAGFEARPNTSVILQADIDRLEKRMDSMLAALPEMKAFVLPGGNPASAALHVSRTVCRRLERQMTRALQTNNNQDPDGRTVIRAEALRYINRLSDYLFVCARYANFLSGRPDVRWESRARKTRKEEG